MAKRGGAGLRFDGFGPPSLTIHRAKDDADTHCGSAPLISLYSAPSHAKGRAKIDLGLSGSNDCAPLSPICPLRRPDGIAPERGGMCELWFAVA